MDGILCIVVIVLLVILGGLSFLGFALISYILTSELFQKEELDNEGL